MSKINESAFPYIQRTEFLDKNHSIAVQGLSKLEYTAIQIFCAMDINDMTSYGVVNARARAIEQAKLLLQECEEGK